MNEKSSIDLLVIGASMPEIRMEQEKLTLQTRMDLMRLYAVENLSLSLIHIPGGAGAEPTMINEMVGKLLKHYTIKNILLVYVKDDQNGSQDHFILTAQSFQLMFHGERFHLNAVKFVQFEPGKWTRLLTGLSDIPQNVAAARMGEWADRY